MMVILHKFEYEEGGEYYWITTSGPETVEWRTDSDFLEIANDAFSRFPDTSQPVMWQRDDNWIITDEGRWS